MGLVYLSLLYGLLIHRPFIPIARVRAPLAYHEFSLSDRYNNQFVNSVFKDNILLTVAYLRGVPITPSHVNWTIIEQPFTYTMILSPGESFAFHDNILPQYKKTAYKTTNLHFTSSEGFRYDGYLIGDGVCHLASLMYWVAKDAGLTADAPTRHDFAPVADVPRMYGVSIYATPRENQSSQMQNLYITNNTLRPVQFKFSYDGKNLGISAI